MNRIAELTAIQAFQHRQSILKVICKNPSQVCHDAGKLIISFGLPVRIGKREIYGGDGVRNMYIDFDTPTSAVRGLCGIRPRKILLEGSSQDYSEKFMDEIFPSISTLESEQLELRKLLKDRQIPHDSHWLSDEIKGPYERIIFSDIRI